MVGKRFIARMLVLLPALALVGCGVGATGEADDGYSKAAGDLDSLYSELRRDPSESGPPPAAVMPPRPAASRAAPSITESPKPPDIVSAPEPRPAHIVPAPPPPNPILETAEQRRERLIKELTEAMAQREAGADDPFSRAIDLTILEALRPGSGAAPLDALRSQLTPPQQEALAALRDLLSSMPKTGPGAGDPGGIARALQKAAARLAAAQPLRIPAAVLCRKVEAFGRYAPLESSAFLAGRAHTVLVYVEVANFAHRPASSSPEQGDEFVVELGQELNIYHDADGLLAWRSPEQPVRESGRNQRTDLFLVQRITLPPTLSVGRYRLKIIVRDKTSGALAEAIIPISVVADASLDHPAQPRPR